MDCRFIAAEQSLLLGNTCVGNTLELARRVSSNTWRTVTNVWKGYHGVPLRESNQNLTTFIKSFGRWRYTRAPQGFLSSEDDYNRCFAVILYDFMRKKRFVDDAAFFDESLEQWFPTFFIWRHTILISCVNLFIKDFLSNLSFFSPCVFVC